MKFPVSAKIERSIKQAWEAQVAVQDVMIFLQTYGISPAQCLKLVHKYGTDTRRIIEEQPYKIVGEIERIGFKAADKIALNLGFPSNSEARLHAGILHALTQLQSSGHTLALESQLASEAQTLLTVDVASIQQALIQLQRQQVLRMVDLQDPLVVVRKERINCQAWRLPSARLRSRFRPLHRRLLRCRDCTLRQRLTGPKSGRALLLRTSRRAALKERCRVK